MYSTNGQHWQCGLPQLHSNVQVRDPAGLYDCGKCKRFPPQGGLKVSGADQNTKWKGGISTCLLQ